MQTTTSSTTSKYRYIKKGDIFESTDEYLARDNNWYPIQDTQYFQHVIGKVAECDGAGGWRRKT